MSTHCIRLSARAAMALLGMLAQGCIEPTPADYVPVDDSAFEDTVDTDSQTNPDATQTDTGSQGGTDSGQGEELTFPIRGAFYYPWYPQTWTVDGEHVFYHPTRGYYSSDDAEVVDRHIEDMDYAKIEVAIASWWGIDGQNQATRIPLLLERTVALGSHLKWAFYYESEGFSDPTIAQIEADLEYLMSTYADHEAVARVDGKPVLFVYNADGGGCDVASRWSKANKGKWYVSLKIFGGYEDCPDQPDTWHQYGPDAPAQQHAGNSYVIAPGFWRADQASALLARDLERWYRNVADMVASLEPWQLVTTFNEWGEGTAVEPATEWESVSGHGQYLDALHSDGVR